MAKEPITRAFSSEEEMKNHAEETYRIGEKKVNEIEIRKGLDITDYESVMNFNIGYIPLQNSVIVKEIPKDLISDSDSILAIDNSQSAAKYYVFAVSSVVQELKKGDIVALGDPQGGPTVPVSKKMFKGIMFYSVPSYYVQGIVTNDENLIKDRIAAIRNASSTGITLA